MCVSVRECVSERVRVRQSETERKLCVDILLNE